MQPMNSQNDKIRSVRFRGFMLLFGLVILVFVLSQQLLTVHAYAGSYALGFDGSNDYVSLGLTENVMGAGWRTTKTVMVWLRPNSTGITCIGFPQCDYIVQDFPEWWGISIGNTSGMDRIWVWNVYTTDNLPCPPAPQPCPNLRIEALNVTYTPGEWVHIALVHDGSRLYAYKNGALVSDRLSLDTQQPSTGAFPTLYIGGYRVSPGVPGRVFDGQIDEVSLWNRALSADEIRQYMYRELSGAETGLSAYYPMSDGTGLVVTDETNTGCAGGTGCDGVLFGAPDWITSGAFTGPRNALDFDGSTGYVTLNANTATIIGGGWASTKSAELWAKPIGTAPVASSAAAGDILFGNAHWGVARATIDSQDRLWLFNNDGVEQRLAIPYTTGEWVHLAVVHAGGNLAAYRNGLAVGSLVSGGTAVDAALFVGGLTAGQNFEGQLDELRIWRDARTATEIQNNMFATVAHDEPDLAAYYRFDQTNHTSMATAYDWAEAPADAHNGTLVNMSPTTDWLLSTAFNTWIGGDSQIWSSGGNWSRYATTDTRLGITRYPNSYSATVTMTTTILDAVLSPNADLVVDDTLTVNERLIGPGHVTVNGNLFNVSHMDVATVTVASGALLEVQNGGVLTVTEVLENNGTLRQTQPVSGSVASFFDTGAYGGVQIDSNGQNLGNTVVSIRGNQNCTNVPDETVRRCFDIAPELSPTIGISITFAFADDELPLVMDCNTLNVYHWNGSGWDVITPTVRTCSSPLSFITVEGVTDFSPFVLRSPNSPTAVTLHSFSMDTPVDAMQLAPIILFLMMITGFVMWQHSRRRAQSVR